MAWVTITNNPDWEYDDAGVPQYPNAPGADTVSGGIRTNPDGTEIYVSCRHKTKGSTGELNKTFWDNHSYA